MAETNIAPLFSVYSVISVVVSSFFRRVTLLKAILYYN